MAEGSGEDGLGLPGEREEEEGGKLSGGDGAETPGKQRVGKKVAQYSILHL